MPDRLRIFLSSPGDVLNERLRADLIIDKLAQDYGRLFAIESYRWEHEPLVASGHFQDAIEPPSSADIVILIVWSRLGTPLPERTAVREYCGIDGRAPVTGTEWEYEDALRAARAQGTPDILAFRNVTPAPIDTRDAAARASSLQQLDALDAFWRRHFADRGVFLAAYDEYRTLEEFAQRFEALLRKLIERRVAARSLDAARGGAAAWLGRPFRGLEAYEFEHAAIFFGRDLLVAKATEQLCAQARAGSAFLLVSGASGSGKSSLVRAAIVPRLMKPHRVPGVAFLRRVAFQPGDGKQDVVLALVEAITRGGSEGVGLPELLRPGQTAADCARALRATADEPGFLFAGALGDLTAEGRRSGRLMAHEEAKLLLCIDQLEELFTAEQIGADDRLAFVRLLAGLARSGAVWVIATIRNDFWHRAAEMPALAALAEGIGRLDVAAPAPAELAEMIRKPAQAAGLAFEVHDETGVALDAVLAADAASEPGALPLLSFTLDALYAADVGEKPGHVLTFASYGALGGLHGAIATRADQVVAALPPAAQACLPRVLRALTTVAPTGDDNPVARAAALDAFPAGTAGRALIDALVEARLLIASGGTGAPSVRLAHEALISHWERAKDQLALDRRDLATRALVERQQARWQAAEGRARRLLLLRDPDLANAVDLATRWGDELEPSTRAFIQESRRHARLRQRLTGAAAVVFALLAVAAAWAQQQAAKERARAERNYAAAQAAVNGLVFNIAQGLRGVEGIRRETVARILETTRATVDRLLEESPDDARLHATRAAMLLEFARIYQEVGDSAQALASATEALAIFRRLAAGAPSEQRQSDVATALTRVGDLRLAANDAGAAREALEEAIAIRRALAQKYPDSRSSQRALSVNLDTIAALRLRGGDAAGARALYEESLLILRRLAALQPADMSLQRDLAVGLATLGRLRLDGGDMEGARAAFEEDLAIMRRVSAGAPENAEWQRDLSVSLNRMGELASRRGDFAGARAFYEEALGIRRRLLRGDPANTRWQQDVATNLLMLGDAIQRSADPAGAQPLYQEALALFRRLAQSDPGDAHNRRAATVALERIGLLAFASGDLDAAERAFAEGLATARALAQQDPGNVDWQLDIAKGLNRIGELRLRRNDVAGARTVAEEEVAVLRRLVERNADALEWQSNLAAALSTLAALKARQGDRAGAEADYRASVAIARRLPQRDPSSINWQRNLAIVLNAFGDFLLQGNALAPAQAIFEESLAIVRRYAATDRSNALWQQDVAITLAHLADARMKAGDAAAALAALSEALALYQALAEGGNNQPWLRAAWQVAGRIRELRAKGGDAGGARAALDTEVALLRRITAGAPGDRFVLRALAIRLGVLGEMRLATGEREGAKPALEEALALARRLSEADAGNAAHRADLALALARIGALRLAEGDKAAARAAYAEALALVQALEAAGQLAPDQKTWRAYLEDALAKLGD